MDIPTTFQDMEKYFHTDITKSLPFREKQLKALQKSLIQYEKELITALKADLGKAPQESYMTEIGMIKEELHCAIKNLHRWNRPKRKATPLANFPGHSCIYSEPYGVVLIISPWNYPLQLSISPLIGSIAAGNCCIIKPSEFSPHTSSVLEKLIAATFSPQYITVIQGGVNISQNLLKQHFDYIFFTGSPQVGRIVMTAAAQHLTPVTLELGGKSPCIVEKSANISLSAKRIAFGKFLNAGQTCVAPDYVLVEDSIKDEFILELKQHIQNFFGTEPLLHKDLPNIITEQHFQRLLNLIESEEVIYGGKSDEETKKIEPTLLNEPSFGARIMQEEIFGPILPILSFRHLEEALIKIKAGEKPLALYVFTKDDTVEQTVLTSLSFGGGCVNDTIMQLASTRLPFGGVGESGMGSYHGKTSFTTFSHEKSIVKKGFFLDIPLRYHPYTGKKLHWIRKILG